MDESARHIRVRAAKIKRFPVIAGCDPKVDATLGSREAGTATRKDKA
jgi:hypothetical protein